MSSIRRIAIAGLLLVLRPTTAGDAAAFSIRTMDLKAYDLIYNPHDGFLYVAVPGGVLERGNTVTIIDPATASFVASIPVGSDPQTLALSDDGSTLYVGLRGASVVKRINIATRSVDLDIPMPTDAPYGPVFASDLSVMPGHPHTFACRSDTPDSARGLRASRSSTTRCSARCALRASRAAT